MLALLHAAGVASILERATCATQCTRDGCTDCTSGALAPVCECHCPSPPTVPTLITTMTIEPARVESRVSFGRADEHPPAPDPFEILHVPRLRLS